jgi:hypothetical protein
MTAENAGWSLTRKDVYEGGTELRLRRRGLRAYISLAAGTRARACRHRPSKDCASLVDVTPIKRCLDTRCGRLHKMSFFEPPPAHERPEPEFEIPEPKPWWRAPSNELGVLVPLRVVLARTNQIAVAVVGVTAYTTGFSLTLALRSRSRRGEEGFDPRMFELPFGHGAMQRPLGSELPPELLRFGIQFADGRKATTLGASGPWGVGAVAEEEEPIGPILSPSGGGGGDGEWNEEYWLWPLPPPGIVTFAIEWPSKGIELSLLEVDSASIIDASKSSEVLWPDAGEGASSHHVMQFFLAAPEEDPSEGEGST